MELTVLEFSFSITRKWKHFQCLSGKLNVGKKGDEKDGFRGVLEKFSDNLPLDKISTMRNEC